MKNSEKRTALLTAGTEFTVNFERNSTDKIFKINRFNPPEEDSNLAAGLAVGVADKFSFETMNIKNVGTKRISFYTYSIFGSKSLQVIRLADITITKVGTEETAK